MGIIQAHYYFFILWAGIMQKFSLLAIGDNFEYQGEHYTKSGPLTANRLENGSKRMIPRSAIVKPLSGTSTETLAIQAGQLPADQVMEAFEHYHRGCLDWLAIVEKVDQALAASIREAMQTARERFTDELNRLSES